MLTPGDHAPLRVCALERGNLGCAGAPQAIGAYLGESAGRETPSRQGA